MQLIINLIQDIATPHNNVLIREFARQEEVKLIPWYAMEEDQELYKWKKNITHEYLPAKIYGKKLNISFILYCLTHPRERYVIVGWANVNTKLLHLLFFLMRRPYNHWTDIPADWEKSFVGGKKICRRLAYLILRCSRSVILCVGKTTIEFFSQIGFSSKRLINMPIFIDTDEDIQAYRQKRSNILLQYNYKEDDFLLMSGSRLVYEKGYDLLIKAISQLNEEVRKKTKLLIVGSGDCGEGLKMQIRELGLERQITIIDWLTIENFKTLIACSNVFVHPAREDSYGGTTLGMALGVPVIGSKGAGAAVDRIEDGRNGFLYETEDTSQLAKCIEKLCNNPKLCEKMGRQALDTAKFWPPVKGLKILVEYTI